MPWIGCGDLCLVSIRAMDDPKNPPLDPTKIRTSQQKSKEDLEREKTTAELSKIRAETLRINLETRALKTPWRVWVSHLAQVFTPLATLATIVLAIVTYNFTAERGRLEIEKKTVELDRARSSWAD